MSFLRDIYVKIGRERYPDFLKMIVQSHVSQIPTPLGDFTQMFSTAPPDALISAFQSITPSTPVLFKTPCVKYRQFIYTLPRPCTLEALAGIVVDLITDLRDTMVAPHEWIFEWENDMIRFVPTFKHRYACVLITRTSEEFTCTEESHIVTKVHAAFDELAEKLEDVPAEIADFFTAARGNVAVHVYDLKTQTFRHQDMAKLYALWIADRCE